MFSEKSYMYNYNSNKEFCTKFKILIKKFSMNLLQESVVFIQTAELIS